MGHATDLDHIRELRCADMEGWTVTVNQAPWAKAQNAKHLPTLEPATKSLQQNLTAARLTAELLVFRLIRSSK